jgi:hypothetical protein
VATLKLHWQPDSEVPVGHPLAFEVPVARLISIITVNSVGRSHLGYTRVRSKLHLPVPTGSLAASSCLWAHERKNREDGRWGLNFRVCHA